MTSLGERFSRSHITFAVTALCMVVAVALQSQLHHSHNREQRFTARCCCCTLLTYLYVTRLLQTDPRDALRHDYRVVHNDD